MWQKAIEVSFDASPPHPHQSDKKKSVTIMDGFESLSLSLSHTHAHAHTHTHFFSAKCHQKWRKKAMTKTHLDSLYHYGNNFLLYFQSKVGGISPNCCRKRSCNYCRNKSKDLGTRTSNTHTLTGWSKKIVLEKNNRPLQDNWTQIGVQCSPEIVDYEIANTHALSLHTQTHTHARFKSSWSNLLCAIDRCFQSYFSRQGKRRSNYMQYKLRQSKPNK